MILQLIKKELLLFWRRPRELVVLLLMPFILITILGAALGAINDGESINIKIKLAVVELDDRDAGEKHIIQQLANVPMDENERIAAMEGIKSFSPIRVLFEEVLESDELKENIDVVYLDKTPTKDAAKAYHGVLEIPTDFTEQFFSHAFLESQEVPRLHLKMNETSYLEGSILQDIVTSFQEEISFWTATQTMGIDVEKLREKIATSVGKTESVSERKSISSVSYYAIGMSVMFMFYVAGNAATLAFEEKENHIFGRILLANLPIPVFFTGIFVSTILLTFIQMNILFGLSALIHDVSWPSITNYLIVTSLLCMMVGAFSVLLCSISYRVNSGGAIQVFSSFLIPIMAFVGGSFVPVAQLGDLFETISSYSPGGAGISAYYKIMQGYSLEDVSLQLIAISITSLLILLIAFMILPRRGESV